MIGAGELIVDSFAGGGGASLGIAMALGRGPDIAINHDAEALAMHAANHPGTLHLSKNIWQVDPLDHVGRRRVALAWFSPDCKHFSKAKGAAPVKRSIRDLAWVVVLWARRARPRVIILENVEEFRDWGPLDLAGRPCRERKGETFDRFVGELRRLGYRVEHREIRACDHGAPTIRKRLFLIARCDGLPIMWPAPTHGAPHDPGVVSGKLKPWRTAAEIIDWSLPCHSIFLSREEGRALGVNRPLADKTMARIAKGERRYVIEAAEPFIVPVTHAGDTRVHGIGEPLRTVTTAHRGEHALVSPFLVPRYGEREGQEPRTRAVGAPCPTVVPTGNGGSLVAAFLAQHNGGMVGHDAREPVSTIVQKGCTQAVVSAGLVNLKGSDRRMAAPDAPAPTICAGGWHLGEVRAFLIKYYGTGGQWQDCRDPVHTVPTRDRLGVVMVAGEPYEIVDIGMRMLSARELFRAQGFPDSYAIDLEHEGRPLTKTAQIRMCGNSVCPDLAAALVRANVGAAAADMEAVA